MSQLYMVNTGGTIMKGPRVPSMQRMTVEHHILPQVTPHDMTLTQELLNVVRPEYTAKQTVKTWYAVLHIAGNIDVAKAFIQKRILNDGACFQIAPCDYVYSGGCEQGMTIRCIHYPRFKENTPEKILERLMKLSHDLAKELGQKSYTIETSENTVYFDNGNKHG